MFSHPVLRLGSRALVLGTIAAGLLARADDAPALDYRIELTTARKGYDGKLCWVHCRAGAIPPGAPGNPSKLPIVVMTTQKLLVTGSDVFYGLHDFRTDDLGKTWDGPRMHETLGRRSFPQGGEIVISDYWPSWHTASKKLLGIGHTVRYIDNAVHSDKNPRWTAYSIYDPQARAWTKWEKLAVPDHPLLASSGAGSVQRHDLPNGDILVPVYYNMRAGKVVPEGSLVLRCRFDGTTLKYVEHGNELTYATGRGFSEPSLAKFGDWYYLTLRNDDFAAVAKSRDGLHYDKPRKWTFDDGKDLGSYNTQAHWVVHSDGLFLVYTRRDANNDHVFRHRAPLFIAQVDPEKLVVRRSTERILVPQRGARLGNFGVTVVSPDETWVTVTEWMQTWGPKYIMPVDNKYGADNSIYVAKIRWNRPNKLVDPWADLPVPDIGFRQEDLAPLYSPFQFVWVRVARIPGCLLDLLCYEHSNLTFVAHKMLDKGALELRHRSNKDPHVLMITTLTPGPGSLEIIARVEVDRERSSQGKLPKELPDPNLCFRVKRAEDCFASYPHPFPSFIRRCFIFTENGRTFLLDTRRRMLPKASADDPRNNPPWVQIYYGVWLPVPDEERDYIWYNRSPDRFTVPVCGVVSRDGKHLVALANDSADRMTQAWQECLHNNPYWTPRSAPPEEQRWRLKVYVMPNDPEALLARVAKDFPEAFNLKKKRIPATPR